MMMSGKAAGPVWRSSKSKERAALPVEGEARRRPDSGRRGTRCRRLAMAAGRKARAHRGATRRIACRPGARTSWPPVDRGIVRLMPAPVGRS